MGCGNGANGACGACGAGQGLGVRDFLGTLGADEQSYFLSYSSPAAAIPLLMSIQTTPDMSDGNSSGPLWRSRIRPERRSSAPQKNPNSNMTFWRERLFSSLLPTEITLSSGVSRTNTQSILCAWSSNFSITVRPALGCSRKTTGSRQFNVF